MISFSEMSKVTWYSRLLSLLFVFGIFPTIVFFIGKRYQETVTVIINSEKAQALAIDNQVYFANNANTASGQAAITENKNILGEWINHQDGKYVMKVKDSNIFYELYEGKIITTGSWVLRNNLPDTKIGSMPQGVYLQKTSVDSNGEEKSFFYKVEFLDNSRMTLNYLENDKALSFSKISTSTTTPTLGE